MYLLRQGKNGKMYKYKDLTGQKVGSYTILYRSETKTRNSNNKATMWTARCECGNIRDLEYSNIASAIKKLNSGLISIVSCGCKSSLPFGVSASKAAYRNYLKNSESRGYEFCISWEEFVEISKGNCHYCGAAPSNKIGATTPNKRGNGYYIYNGIDRMDNNVGYVKGNIVPCCRRCNRAKDVMGVEEFLKWVNNIYDHSILKIKNN